MRAFGGFGQYVDTDSVLHRLDAAAKMGILAAFTAGLFMVRGFAGLAVFSAAVIAGAVLARAPLRVMLRGLNAVGLVLAFTVLLNALAWRPAAALVQLGPVALMGPGLTRGAFFAVRIVALVLATTLLTVTTSPIEISGGLERSLRPLSLVGIPVADLAMTLTIALRFVPTTAQEADAVITAQAARGARFDEGGPVTRARAYIPVLVPMFYNLFRRADALATAMEARCYRGSEGRTRLRERRMGPVDWVSLIAAAALFVAAGWFL